MTRLAVLMICVACSGLLASRSQMSIAAEFNGGEEKPATSKATDDVPKIRQFTFHYRFRVTGLKPAADAKQADVVRVWLPCPPSHRDQQIKRHAVETPGQLSEHVETQNDNRILHFTTAIPNSGEFTVDIPYDVVRHEVRRAEKTKNDVPAETLERNQRAALLGPNRLVPITGKPLKMLDSIELQKDKLGLARQLYDLVDGHVTYKKDGTGWGNGDTNWVCDSGYGNCTDFHSLFISLARSQQIPARFEIGFSIPTGKSAGPVAGYHCWAWFFIDERGWIPVDISEADKAPKLKDYYFGNLTADRVTFSAGRDLKLVPEATSPPLNFFIRPHIEVGGKALPPENIELQHTFAEKP